MFIDSPWFSSQGHQYPFKFVALVVHCANCSMGDLSRPRTFFPLEGPAPRASFRSDCWSSGVLKVNCLFLRTAIGDINVTNAWLYSNTNIRTNFSKKQLLNVLVLQNTQVNNKFFKETTVVITNISNQTIIIKNIKTMQRTKNNSRFDYPIHLVELHLGAIQAR